jgi:hypothetical protein
LRKTLLEHYQTVEVIDTLKEKLYTVPQFKTGPMTVFPDLDQRQPQPKGKQKMADDIIKGGEPTTKKKAKRKPATKKAAPKKATKKKAAKKR